VVEDEEPDVLQDAEEPKDMDAQNAPLQDTAGHIETATTLAPSVSPPLSDTSRLQLSPTDKADRFTYATGCDR
jgi:hypothetical protein